MKKTKGVDIGRDNVELFKKLMTSSHDVRVAIHFKYLPRAVQGGEEKEEIVYHFEKYDSVDKDLPSFIRCVQISSRLSDPFRLGGVTLTLEELDFMLFLPTLNNAPVVFLKGDKYYERTFMEVYPKGWQDFCDKNPSEIKALEDRLKTLSLSSQASYTQKHVPSKPEPPKSILKQPKNRYNDLQRIKELESFLLSEIKEDDTSS